MFGCAGCLTVFELVPDIVDLLVDVAPQGQIEVFFAVLGVLFDLAQLVAVLEAGGNLSVDVGLLLPQAVLDLLELLLHLLEVLLEEILLRAFFYVLIQPAGT